MAGRGRSPLAELLQLVQCEAADQRQLGIKHGGHVARVEEEAVARFPRGMVRVEGEKFGVEHIDEICSAHSPAGMSGLCFFYHCYGQDAYIVRGLIHKFRGMFHNAILRFAVICVQK